MNKERLKAAIYGTLVADAAGMGLHWIYSQGKIASIIKKHGGTSEFLEPDEAHYKGVPCFFAHPFKHAGDGSNYGSYIYVLLKSMADAEPGAPFSSGNFIRVFQEYYGIGGEYVGYADTPMRETIYNITTIAKSLKAKVAECPSSLSDEKKDAVASYISLYFFRHDSEGLKAALRNVLKVHEFTKDEMLAVDALADSVSDTSMRTGIDDDQMPGLTRSALFAGLYSGAELDSSLEKAVRITNDNDLCVAYSLFMAHILADFYRDLPAAGHEQNALKASVQRHLGILPPNSQALLSKAMDYEALDYRTATKTFGAACHVDMAIPVSIHILLHTKNFEDATRTNTLASGDNCGRAIFLGAVAGAMYGIGGERGIPDAWVKKTALIPTVAKLL